MKSFLHLIKTENKRVSLDGGIINPIYYRQNFLSQNTFNE